MKRLITSAIIFLSCLGVASSALADGPRRGDHGRQHYSGKHERSHGKSHYGKHPGARGPHGHWQHRKAPPRVHYAPPQRHGRAAPRWQKGHRLPAHYRHDRYVVRDWKARHFHRPPPGYHWVNVGADYLLVGIATGIVLQAVLGR